MSYAIDPEKYKITFTPRTRRNKRGRTLRGYQPRDPTTGNLRLQKFPMFVELKNSLACPSNYPVMLLVG